MNLFPKNIRLNGEKVSVDELFKKSTQNTKQEKDLAVFLKEWYAPRNFIEVKSSGSTGPAKTIRLKKEFVALSAQRTLTFFQLQKGDRALHCLPAQYIAAKLMIVRALLGKLDLIVVEPTTDFLFLKKEKFRFSAMVPNQISKILLAGSSHGELLQNIDQVLIGGSAIPYSLEKDLMRVPSACYSSYGMTETATHIALRKINGACADGWYHCLENISVTLSAKGCLQIFMPGVAQQPLQTTDLAEIKNEKTFRVLGRIDNMIISGGIKFSAEQLEKKLGPFISEPFLISFLPHESLGQQLVLVVEGAEKKEAIEKLQEICLLHLDKFEQPRKIIFVDQVPITANGKPDRMGLDIKAMD